MKTILGIKYSVNQKEKEFKIECSLLNEDRWNNHREQILPALERFIDEAIIKDRKQKSIMDPTDPNSIKYAVHFIQD